jgi:hypothetical protein
MDKLSNKQIEKWVWILIYSGMAIFFGGLYAFVHGSELAVWVMVAGVLDVTAGAWLVWLRSRRD